MPTQTPVYNMTNLLKVLCSLATSSTSRLFRHARFWGYCYSKTPLLQAQGLNSDGAWLQGHSYTTTCTLGLGLAVVTEESCAVRASSLFRSAVKCWCRVPFSRFALLPIVRWCPKSKLLTPCYMCHQKNAILDQCSDVVYCDWWDSVTASACRIGENLKNLGLVPNWSETVPRISNSSWSRLNCVTSCKKIWRIFFKLFL